jgi:hypothetical protein
MCLCEKCGKMMALIVLILGVVYLLVDLNIWSFWGIKWWTAVFILAGLGMFCSGGCPMCLEEGKKKK